MVEVEAIQLFEVLSLVTVFLAKIVASGLSVTMAVAVVKCGFNMIKKIGG